MNNKSTRNQLFIVLIETALIGVTILLITLIGVKRLPYKLIIIPKSIQQANEFISISEPLDNSCLYGLYDENGNGYKAIITNLYDSTGSNSSNRRYVYMDYVALAPLYDVKPETLGIKKTHWAVMIFQEI